MSTLKVDGIRSNSASSDAITLASDGTCTANITNNLGNRNLIINGAMQVAQRGTTTGITGQSYGGPDRFETHIANLGTWTTSQVSSSADQNTTGFLNSFKTQCTTADASPAASDYAVILQHIEGYNVTQLQWGTANAKPVTLSFWCKANISGWSSGTKSFVAELQGGTTTFESGQLVTLNTNDTWQKITLTFPAQTSQALNTTNASGISVNFWVDAGSNFKSGTLSSSWSNKANADRVPGLTLNLGNNTANYFQITGIQLEAGSVATDFEHRSYGQELALCQRYYQVIVRASDYGSGIAPICNVIGYQTNNVFGVLDLPVSMRSSPSLDAVSGTGYWKCFRNAGSGDFNSILLDQVTNSRIELNFYGVSSGTTIDADQPGWMRTNDSSAFIGLQAEL